MLEVKNLTKYYGKTKGIEDFNLKLKKGEIFGLIGPNGAGKSTTIRAILDLINKDKGTVYLEHELLTRKNIELYTNIGYIPGETHLYEDMLVKEIFELHESILKKNLTKRKEELIIKFKIDINKKIKELSLGNLKKVSIVLALMHNPELIILDEATSGLDPIMQNTLFDILKEEKSKGKTIIYSTHILSEIKNICDRYGIIKNGNLIKVSKVSNINNEKVITIISNDVESIKKELKIKNKITDKTLKFNTKKDINEIIRVISKYNIDDININDESIEDTLINYYK